MSNPGNQVQDHFTGTFLGAKVEFTILSTNNNLYTISPNEDRVMRTSKTLGSILRATNFASSFHYRDRDRFEVSKVELNQGRGQFHDFKHEQRPLYDFTN